MSVGAVVIAAGLSQRLGALWPGVPKPMIPVNGEPVASRIVRWLLEEGVEPVTVVWGPVEPAAGPVPRDGALTAEYFSRSWWQQRPVRLLPGKSAGSAVDALLGISATPTSTVLVVACDIVVDLPLRKFVTAVAASGCAGGVALSRRADVGRGAEYGVGADGRILGRRANGLPRWGEPGAEVGWWGATFGVGLVHRVTVLDLPGPESGAGFGAAVYDHLARLGQLYAYDNGERFVVDIGTPGALLRLADPDDPVAHFLDWPDHVVAAGAKP
jgi:NDP-sugar pyrophosphorylase family protein